MCSAAAQGWEQQGQRERGRTVPSVQAGQPGQASKAADQTLSARQGWVNEASTQDAPYRHLVFSGLQRTLDWGG